MNGPDQLIQLIQDETRATVERRYRHSRLSPDVHAVARARRDYLNDRRALSARVIGSLQDQEQTMTSQTSNQNTEPNDQDGHADQAPKQPADRYAFPAHWPVTGPFANQNQE